VQEVN